jgi:hypothetical protein
MSTEERTVKEDMEETPATAAVKDRGFEPEIVAFCCRY